MKRALTTLFRASHEHTSEHGCRDGVKIPFIY